MYHQHRQKPLHQSLLHQMTLNFLNKFQNKQKVKKALTDISRRFSKRILLKKQKDGNSQGQETVKRKQKKKDLEMQTISKPLTPVAQTVTDRLYNEDKISKGGPVKKSSTKATRGGGRSKKNSSVKIVLYKKKKEIFFCVISIFLHVTHIDLF